MIIDCVSDLHGKFPVLSGGDLLIVAGDCTSNDSTAAWMAFFSWLEAQNYKKKITVAGNHDNFLTSCISTTEAAEMGLDHDLDFDYLCDSGTEFGSLKIWGSPWTRSFEGMNPHCKAFTLDTEEQLAEKFALIPHDVDILITHGPPNSVLDRGGRSMMPLGSFSLFDELDSFRIKPKLHVFGHIHEFGSQFISGNGILFINASYMDECYLPRKGYIRCRYLDSSFTGCLIPTPMI